MKFQSKMWTRQFQRDSKMIGQLMNASIIPFLFMVFSLYLNVPPIPIDDSLCLNKKSIYLWYDSAAIYFIFLNSVSKLITPYDSAKIIVLNPDYPNTQHTIMSDNPFRVMTKIGYCSRFHDGKRRYKKSRFFCSMCSINNKPY